MSLLILGGDRINPILNLLEELGVTDVIHWTARNQKNGRKKGILHHPPKQVDSSQFQNATDNRIPLPAKVI
jgi:hypothetical protein